MADSYHLRDGRVIPFYGGRMCTDTTTWRDATPLEIEQHDKILDLELEIDNLRELVYRLSNE